MLHIYVVCVCVYVIQIKGIRYIICFCAGQKRRNMRSKETRKLSPQLT